MNNRSIESAASLLEFKMELISGDKNVNKMLLDRKITKPQFELIVKLMSEYRDHIYNHLDVNNEEFEQSIYLITGFQSYDFGEELAKAFMEDGDWVEVFPALYGNMPKYRDYMQRRSTKVNST